MHWDGAQRLLRRPSICAIQSCRIQSIQACIYPYLWISWHSSARIKDCFYSRIWRCEKATLNQLVVGSITTRPTNSPAFSIS